MAGQDDFQALTTTAERLLHEHVGRQVSLHQAVLIAERGRSVVVRCSVEGWDGIASIVCKRNTGDDERGFTDWASLAFLSEMPEAAGIAPRFFAGDPTERLLVMEDLGGSRSLADVLDVGDDVTTRRALQELARVMARLVAATFDREQNFARMRAALPGAGNLGRRREAERWLEGRARLEHWTDLLGVALPLGFGKAMRHVAALYAEPGPYLAFSHGDPAPSNNHVRNGQVRLIDFEYGGYRHALYDLSAWNVLCPMPEPWVAEMEHVFRTLLAEGTPRDLLADQKLYHEAWAAMCAYRALAMLTWFPHELLLRQQPWAPGWTMRQAMISTTLRLQQAAGSITPLDPLAAYGEALGAVVRARWPELEDGALVWPAPGGRR